MVSVLLNLVALGLVVAFCLVGMRWFGPALHRFLGGRADDHEEPIVIDVPRSLPCAQCDGVGALRGRGALRPCPVCEGTGVAVPG